MRASKGEQLSAGRGRPSPRAALAVAAACLVLAAFLPAVGKLCRLAAESPGSSEQACRNWLAGALTGKAFVLGAGMAICSAAGLALVGGILWQAGGPHRRAWGSQGGAVVLEFALALPIAMVLSLIMAQSSLLMAGNLCVQYSAYAAARTAIVQIPLDLSDGEPANVLDSYDASGKIARIRKAALWAVMPVSPAAAGQPADPRGDDLAAGLKGVFQRYSAAEPRWLNDDRRPGEYLGRKLAYADQYTAVTMLRRASLPGEPPEYAELDHPYSYQEHEEVRVTVDHVFFLAVPYASKVFAALGDGSELTGGPGLRGLSLKAACSLTNEGAANYIEVETFE